MKLVWERFDLIKKNAFELYQPITSNYLFVALYCIVVTEVE